MRTCILTPVVLAFNMVTKPLTKYILIWKEKWLILIGGVSSLNDISQIK